MNQRIPIFKEMAGNLSGQIRERDFAPGTALPSENELCRQYNTSRFSVRKALSLLEAEGLIVRQPGIGSIVRGNPGETPAQKQLNIGISGTGPGNHYSEVVYEGAGSACNACNARLIFTSYADFIANGGDGFDGFILLAQGEPYSSWEKLNALAAAGKPSVFLNRITDLPHIAYVAVDYELESRRAVELLFRLGKRRVGLVGSKASSPYANATRSSGYRIACEAAGMPEVNCQIVESLEAIDQVEAFIAGTQPDALFVTCRNILDYVLVARRNCGRPDIAVFCFDKLEPQQKRSENVMFVDMPLQEMADQAVRYIAEKCRSREPVPVMRRLFDTDFVFSSNMQ